MAIESAKDLFVANGADLRHWHDVSADIIKYLNKLHRAIDAVVYKGTLPNMAAFEELDPQKGDTWTNLETGVNLSWNGTQWIPVSLFRMDFDKEPIEGSTNAIQSGYIWTALQNFIDDPTIYRIVAEADNDPELVNALEDVSNRLADIIQDLADLTEKFERIPDPLLSPEEANELTKAEDGGLFFDSEHCRLAQRVAMLESSQTIDVGDPIHPENGYYVVSEESPDIIYIETDEDLTLNFEALQKTKWMVRHVYIEALANIRLVCQNAEYANVSEAPQYGNAGYGILIRCTWVAGKVILEVLDNSQTAVNVDEWYIDSTEHDQLPPENPNFNSGGSEEPEEPEPEPEP